jgi:predicted transposase YbfD/YdcC
MVNVWAVGARMSLASRKGPGRNEAAGALEVLRMPCLKHCVITADALHCHREFAAAVLKQGGDRAGTQRKSKQVSTPWRGALPGRVHTALPNGSDRPGRIDANGDVPPSFATLDSPRRTISLESLQSPALPRADASMAARRRWPPCDTMCSPNICRRTVASDRASTLEHRKPLHWTLDVVFDEDRCRASKDIAPENLAILRRLASNIIRSHPAPMSMRQKIKTAGWDNS